MSRTLDSSASRGSPTAGSGFNPISASMQLSPNSQYHLEAPCVPPFDTTKQFHQIVDANGSSIHVDLQARIDKGFFKAESDWTCYRRNYFSVACCYCLKPDVDLSTRQLYLLGSSNRDRIQSFSVLITAKIDGEEGKVIDLVQHTPKRDKGPMGPPDRTEVAPHPSGNLGVFNSGVTYSTETQMSSDFSQAYPTGGQTQNVANFDRIQFKKATANNGKRRAAQQYFHIIVELYAKVSRGTSSEMQEVKVAHRVSAPMVVRGRSPGHYSDERRGSSTSMGPSGGSGGDYNHGQRDSGSAGPSGVAHGSISGLSYTTSSHGGSGGYQTHHTTLVRSPTASHSDPSSESSSNRGNRGGFGGRHSHPAPTLEEAANIDEYPGYQYFPATLYETPNHIEPSRAGSSGFRCDLPKPGDNPVSTSSSITDFIMSPRIPTSHDSSKSYVKAEQPRKHLLEGLTHGHSEYGTNAYMASSNHIPSVLRTCGRFQGVESSKGYYPIMPTL
ncbi:hypothetical protein MMC26_003835 [Xylographa opegraphella]|nr:hypothetical protein [Xylographa opegraphella]